jgi:hypothetical protein
MVVSGFVLPTTLHKWNIQNLNYNWYFALTILGGYFGWDYMYLGSPLLGTLKFGVNLFAFGFWYWYDILNAALSQDQIRLYGPVAPVIGSTGIAGGRFRDSKVPSGPPEKLDKHLNFLIYGLVLIFFGAFGGDSFLTGKFTNGVIRLFGMIFMIGAPISIFWWLTNLYYYFLDTGAAIDQNWEYFGTAPPGDRSAECPSVLMIFTVWLLKTGLVILKLFPFTDNIASFLETLIQSLEVAYGFIQPVVSTAVGAVIPLMTVLEAEKNRPIPPVAELKKPSGIPSAPAESPLKIPGGLKIPGVPDLSKMPGMAGMAGKIPDMSKVTEMAGKIPDMSKVTEMAGKIPDMSKVTEMAGKIPDMSKVTEMAGKIPDMSKVTEMAGKIPDMSKVTEMAGKIPDISKVTEMAGKIPDMSKVTEMAGKIPDMSKVTEMAGKIPDMSKVTGKIPDMSKMTEMAKKMPKMFGGGEEDNDGILGPFLVLTIGFIVVSSIVVSLRRSSQNTNATAAKVSPKQSGGEETDEPPNPGNLRNPTPAT